MPVAVTEKDAVWPATTDWLAGCAAIVGRPLLDELGVAYPVHPTGRVANRRTNKNVKAGRVGRIKENLERQVPEKLPGHLGLVCPH